MDGFAGLPSTLRGPYDRARADGTLDQEPELLERLDVVVDVEVPVRFGRWHLGDAHGRARAGPG